MLRLSRPAVRYVPALPRSGDGMERQSPTRYGLRAADGRMVTFDTRSGAELTANAALAYAWVSAAEAERQRPVFASLVGAALAVVEIMPR